MSQSPLNLVHSLAEMQRYERLIRRDITKSVLNPLKALARLVEAFSPSATFSHSGPGVHFPIGKKFQTAVADAATASTSTRSMGPRQAAPIRGFVDTHEVTAFERSDSLSSDGELKLQSSRQRDAVRRPVRMVDLDADALNKRFRQEASASARVGSGVGAYAAIFRLEVLVDISSLHAQAWKSVADQFSWRQPEDEEVRHALTMQPASAIMKQFYYTFDSNVVSDAAKAFEEALGTAFDAFADQLDGFGLERIQGYGGIIRADAITWLQTLSRYECRVAVVSPLNDDRTRRLLTLVGLDDIDPVLLTKDDAYDSDQQAFLGAAWKLERPPALAAVFGLAPTDAIAAHDAGMRAVCLIGSYSLIDLQTADRTILSFDSMNIMDFKGFFPDIEFDLDGATRSLPKLEMQPEPSRRAELKVEALNERYREEAVEQAQLGIGVGAFAAIFRLETVLDITSVYKTAWQSVADHFMWRPPTEEEVRHAQTMQPESAIRNEFYYTLDWKETCDAAEVFVEEFTKALDNFSEELVALRIEGHNGLVSPDTVAWLQTLSRYDCPIAVVSPLNDAMTRRMLKLAGLDRIGLVLLTQDDGYDRDQQAFLGAAVKLMRPPECAAVFGLAPTDAIAAHDAGMRVVCLVGAYPLPDLRAADRSIMSFADMNIQGFREFFRDVVLDPDGEARALQLEPEPETKKQTRLGTLDA